MAKGKIKSEVCEVTFSLTKSLKFKQIISDQVIYKVLVSSTSVKFTFNLVKGMVPHVHHGN